MQRHLIVICEECGKKYRVDTAKINGLAAGFSCRSCGHRILVARSRPDGGGGAAGATRTPGVPGEDRSPGISDARSAEAPSPRPERRPGIGLTLTAVLLFFVLPAVVTVGGGWLLWDRVEGMVDASHRQSALTLMMIIGGCVLTALGMGLLFGMRLAGRVR
jgi:DNA-directed RNA polymerase subunit RPC12/RpoP